MEPQFSVFGHIGQPVVRVYEAVADPDQLARYFTTGGARGRLVSGATVWWDFHDFPGEFPVQVIEATPPERIVLEWDSNEPVPEGEAPRRTRVTFAFDATDDGRTRVEISESGWAGTDTGFRASYGNCMGWSQMLCALKAWLEYGINLREGMYR
ncbi:SRPBCC domain-containing protein [Stenotrophomonas sp. HITSZ_GD]|uniref:SRPBCC domain-containing protein n=1 Tax=Stenotrophomonas sp. HITSZ_GD TaxID=3037248 RepID=UPI00240E72A7|nr:SRPBCC domain-containing protein [Stenotrophomonas sp. HITSZ_GD]MDG2524077.1 SRPBCC domain-containing protein [Stenotrophomonas sp. HITSZ_GD]